jgi:Zn-dependent peptidase ImmA (M78 family)
MKTHVESSNNLVSKEYIQRSVNDTLEKYKQKVGFITPPICEKTLCKVIEELKGINIALEPDENTSIFDEGLLMPIQRGFIIKYGTVNKNLKQFHNVKIRETICHELAHILFYDCSYPIPQLKAIPPEYLCHDIARQLLLPEQIVREKFLEKVKVNSNLIHIIEQLSRDFQVALMLVVRRLTEDMSLLKDTMVTFWRYKSEKGGRYKGYHPNPKLSPELRELLPKYWRDRVHIEAWDKVVSKLILRETNNLPEFLCIEGKRRNKGSIKNIPFKIQCVSLYNSFNNLSFDWENDIAPVLNLLSIKTFDLDILKNERKSSSKTVA